ncbi:MAG: hypothetical protein ACFFFB_00260 [Candidatus Heimdallarchaeota archaeon]
MSVFGTGTMAASSISPVNPALNNNSSSFSAPSLHAQPCIFTDEVNRYSLSFFIFHLFNLIRKYIQGYVTVL